MATSRLGERSKYGSKDQLEYDDRRVKRDGCEPGGHSEHERGSVVGRRASPDGYVVAGSQLPIGRPDLLDGQSAVTREAGSGACQTAIARPLGHDAGPQFPIRPPE